MTTRVPISASRDQFKILLTPGLRDRIKEIAKSRGQSMTTAVLIALHEAFPSIDEGGSAMQLHVTYTVYDAPSEARTLRAIVPFVRISDVGDLEVIESYIRHALGDSNHEKRIDVLSWVPLRSADLLRTTGGARP